MVKKLASFVIRFGIGFGIILWLSRNFDLSKAILAIYNSNVLLVSISLTIILIIRFLVVIRWKTILNFDNINISFRKLFMVNYISTAVGQVLPGGVGGDLLRGYKISKIYSEIVNTSSSIILDRIIGILSMFATAIVGSIIANFIGLKFNTVPYLILVLLLLSLFFLIANINFMKFINGKIKSNRVVHILQKIDRILKSTTNIKKLKSIFLSVFSISIFIQGLRTIIFYLLFLALGVDVSFVYFLVAVPITLFLSIIPISIGGLGVREGALIYFFTNIGVAAETCISVGLLFHILQIIASVPGILFWILNVDSEKQ